MYNRETAYVREREEAGAAFVFRPPYKLNVGHIEHDPEKLLSVYLLGSEEALKNAIDPTGYTVTSWQDEEYKKKGLFGF